jgi:hypothetical protein
MKKSISILTLIVAVTAVVTGCNRDSGNDNSTTVDTNTLTGTNDLSLDNTNPSVSQQATAMATNAWAKTKEATTNAWQDIKESLSSAWDYSYDKKEAFMTDATNDLSVLDQKIQTLSDKAATANDNVKADAQVKLQELRAKRAVLDQKLTDVRNSTEATWNDAKAGFQASYEDAKSSVKQAWQWLKDKMNQ